MVPKSARAKPQKARLCAMHSSWMGTSWSLARGFCSVERVTEIHGGSGFVCDWQVAKPVVKAHQAKKTCFLTHIGVRHLQAGSSQV